jgi:outer membrane lipoprotein carrier protein
MTLFIQIKKIVLAVTLGLTSMGLISSWADSAFGIEKEPAQSASSGSTVPVTHAASPSITVSNSAGAAVELRQLLSHFTTYQAHFAQITYSTNGRELQNSQGQVLIKRPGGFRWETQSPMHQVIITDGRILWIYDIDLAQATRQLFSTKVALNPAVLLSGSLSDISRVFTVKRVHVREGLQSYLLKPKQQQTFKTLVFSFDHGELVGMITENNLDQQSVFAFTKIKLNAPMKQQSFELIPPPDVDVVEEQQ